MFSQCFHKNYLKKNKIKITTWGIVCQLEISQDYIDSDTGWLHAAWVGDGEFLGARAYTMRKRHSGNTYSILSCHNRPSTFHNQYYVLRGDPCGHAPLISAVCAPVSAGSQALSFRIPGCPVLEWFAYCKDQGWQNQIIPNLKSKQQIL